MTTSKLTIDNKPVENLSVEEGLNTLLRNDAFKSLHNGDSNVTEQEFGALLDLIYPEKNKINRYDCLEIQSKTELTHEQYVELVAEYQIRFPQGVKRIGLERFFSDGFLNQTTFEVNYQNINHYKIRMSRQEGEIRLHQFTKTENKEEAWIYLTGIDKDDKKVEWWYEVGTNETSDSATFHMAKTSAILKNFKTVDEISFYHIHPEIQAESPLISETPSVDDFRGDAIACHYLTNILDAEGSDKIKSAVIDFRIVTPNGKYELVPDLKMFKENYDFFAQMLNGLGYPMKRIEFILDRLYFEGSITERAQQFAQSISTPALKITYTPTQK